MSLVCPGESQNSSIQSGTVDLFPRVLAEAHRPPYPKLNDQAKYPTGWVLFDPAGRAIGPTKILGGQPWKFFCSSQLVLALRIESTRGRRERTFLFVPTSCNIFLCLARSYLGEKSRLLIALILTSFSILRILTPRPTTTDPSSLD